MVADDTIFVSAAGFNGGLTLGAVITAAQFKIGAAATNTSQRFIYNATSDDLFFDADGDKVAIAPVQIASLSPNLALTNNDISVVL